MRWVAVVLGITLGCSASVVQFTALPKSIELPSSSSTLRTSEISALNEVLLGLTTKQVSSFPVKTSLFSAPRALAVVDVSDVDKLNLDGATYDVEVDGYDVDSLDHSLALTFGADRETVSLSKYGAIGSQLSQQISTAKVDDSVVKTKSEPLRTELLQIYKLISVLKAQGAKLTENNSPDVYRISISGLAKLTESSDRKSAISEIEDAIKALTDALVETYGSQAVVEVVATPSALQESSSGTSHKIVKRETADPDEPSFSKLRKIYNVSVFTSPDYPAIFAIFAGISIILAIAVVYIAVGIWNMDPGRDSIIYRMTTTRMKKD